MYMYHKAKLLSSNEVSVFLCFNGFFDSTYGFASSSLYPLSTALFVRFTDHGSIFSGILK